MRTATLRRLIAVSVAAVVMLLGAPGVASASVSTLAVPVFSDAVPDVSQSNSWIHYCSGSGATRCSTSGYAQVSWGGDNPQNSLGFLPARAVGGTPVVSEIGVPFRLGQLDFRNTPIPQDTGIRSVVLTLALEVADSDRGDSFTSSVALPLTVDEVADNLPTCPYNTGRPCADAILLPSQPVTLDVVSGSVSYRLEILGLGGTGSGFSQQLVGLEGVPTSAPLMGRLTRTVDVAADAGEDQAVDEGTPVTLDGTGSQGTGLVYAWRQIAGPSVVLDDSASSRPTFATGRVSRDETVEFELTVSDPIDPQSQDIDTVAVLVRNLNAPPVLSLPGDFTVTATGTTGAPVTFTVGATDADGAAPPTVACLPESGTTFPVGTTTVSCSVTDDEGATVTGTFTVRVNAPPQLRIPAGLTVDATTPAGAPVTFQATATDEGPVVVACTPESGTTFGIGATTVDCTATDEDGATDVGSFTVVVLGPPDQLADLLVAVTGVGPGTSLADKVRDAIGSLSDDEQLQACAPLRDFVSEVRAQSGRRIAADVAAQFIADATRIRAVLACR